MGVIASILERNGLYVGAARRGEKLVATVLPLSDQKTVKEKLMEKIRGESIEFKDDMFCLSVSEKIFRAYQGERVEFNEPIDLSSLPPFQRRVLEEGRKINWGTVASYSQLAEKIGNKKAARAVGNAMAANPLCMVIGCHRIVRNDGKIGNFAYGTEMKKKLLQNEGIKIKGDKIIKTG
ncbi:MAG: methylated-DNA--[protein]-cysteine S-methyltransferase [Candidatus Jordarchaeaceae archaeon]